MSENRTPPAIGSRVRALRERDSLTQRDLARHLGIPRSAVSDIEQGKRELSAVELFALSRLFGEPMERVLGVEPPGEGEDVMFRADALPLSGQKQLREFLEWCRFYRQLEEWLGERRAWSAPVLPGRVSSYAEAHRLADQERKRLDLGLTPGRVLLDVFEQRLGIKVLARPLDDTLSGVSVLSPRFGPAVLINSGQSGGRQVFTLAHEYFHLITAGTSPKASRTQLTHICAVEAVGGRRGKPREEQLADQFAGRLLLPPEHFLERLQALRRDDGSVERLDLIDLARYFGLSVQAVFVGLARLRLVPWELANAAYQDEELQVAIVARGGEERPEPLRFKRLAVKAYLMGRLTRARLAELLGLSLAEVENEIERLGARRGPRPVKLGALPG